MLSTTEATSASAGDRDELLGQLLELDGQRRLRLVLALQHPGDVADLGRHARRRDDELARPARHVGVHVDHVGAVAERRVRRRDRLDALADGQALAGQRRLGHLQRRGREHPPVGRARTSPASISTTSPGHELLGRQLRERAVAAHARLDDHHLRQRRHRRRRLALLVEAEHGVEQRQQQDHDPRARLLDRVDRDHARGQQHDLHRVAGTGAGTRASATPSWPRRSGSGP